jgi:hypothetical protein
MRLARIGIPAYYGRKLERENRAATQKTLTELDISKDQTSRSRSTVGSRLGYGSLDDLLWRGRPSSGEWQVLLHFLRLECLPAISFSHLFTIQSDEAAFVGVTTLTAVRGATSHVEHESIWIEMGAPGIKATSANFSTRELGTAFRDDLALDQNAARMEDDD